MYEWKVIIEVWPYYDPPASEAQAKIAPRVREFLIKAHDFREADSLADHILMGVTSHDKVHKANLWAVMRHPTPTASKT